MEKNQIEEPNINIPFEKNGNLDDINSTVLKPRLNPSCLDSTVLVLPHNQVFVDKILPKSKTSLEQNPIFDSTYFVNLHNMVSSAGQHYPCYTPNHCGARISLQHSQLRIDRWRQCLKNYHEPELVQYLQFGFPLGLTEDPSLVSTLRNHGSAYQYFDFVDEFIATGLVRCEIAGPFETAPFMDLHTSPLMTAPKKPDSRRAVFDATFGEFSLNNNTPRDTYLNNPCVYDYPSVDDFKQLILEEGRGCFIWKRDLSRFYMQIPLDPVEYPKVCYVWRKKLYFFTSLMFGLTHSGLQGQKVSSAVRWIHENLGLETEEKVPYRSLNYSDDIGGCESTLSRASASFNALGELFAMLGLLESESKAFPPSTRMPYLGVMFDTENMTMSVPPEKIQELREELDKWNRRKSMSKKSLQSLLGKLFWVSRCVKYSRGFMGRLLGHLRDIHDNPDNKKIRLPSNCLEDIKWWTRYIRRFNGVELIFPEEPTNLTINELETLGAMVYCGDAQPHGGGAYFANEYWSRSFPTWLSKPDIPIHIKEFWVLIASTALWGDLWRGKQIHIFCDNSAVVEVLDKERPKSEGMIELLREFLYLVCTRGFTPTFRHIGTKENRTADFLSRVHNQDMIDQHIAICGINLEIRRDIPDGFFKPSAIW